MSQDQRRYNDQEVSEILRRALERQLKRQSVAGTTKNELIDVAREVGVPQADIEAAANELDAEQRGEPQIQSLESYQKLYKRRRRRSFLTHLSVYTLVIGFLFAINYLTTGLEIPWFLFPALGWGLGLGIHGAVFLLGEATPEELKERMEREEKARRRKRKREEATDALVEGATNFGHAVTREVGTLLGNLAQGLQNRANPPQNQTQQPPLGLPQIERPTLDPNTSAEQPEEVSVGGSNRTRSNR
jgi:uncharacterized membrane protein (DUF485 family)